MSDEMKKRGGKEVLRDQARESVRATPETNHMPKRSKLTFVFANSFG